MSRGEPLKRYRIPTGLKRQVCPFCRKVIYGFGNCQLTYCVLNDRGQLHEFDCLKPVKNRHAWFCQIRAAITFYDVLLLLQANQIGGKVASGLVGEEAAGGGS